MVRRAQVKYLNTLVWLLATCVALICSMASSRLGTSNQRRKSSGALASRMVDTRFAFPWASPLQSHLSLPPGSNLQVQTDRVRDAKRTGMDSRKIETGSERLAERDRVHGRHYTSSDLLPHAGNGPCRGRSICLIHDGEHRQPYEMGVSQLQ
jgi:hypothetical protein